MAEYKKTPVIPIIILVFSLLVLMLMMALRMRSSSDEVTLMATIQAKAVDIVSTDGPKIVINGKAVTDYAAPRATVLANQDPQRWQLAQISRIEGGGSRATLVFIDGSSRDVNGSLLRQLPGEIAVRLRYERPN
jgi:hypothetical protein